MPEPLNPHFCIPGHQSLRVGNLTCWVSAEGRPKVIGTPHRTKKNDIFTCWIESKAGQQFSVNWHNNCRSQSLEGRLYIDGVLCDTHLLPDSNIQPACDPYWSTINLGWAQSSDNSRRNFCFADGPPGHSGKRTKSMNKTTSDVESSKEIGTIKLEIRRVSLTSTAPMIDPTYDGEVLGEYAAGKELLKMTHYAEFGSEYHHAPRQLLGAQGEVLDELPYYTFMFQYRPIDYLLANNLMPLQFLRPPPVYGRRRFLSFIPLDPPNTNFKPTPIIVNHSPKLEERRNPWHLQTSSRHRYLLRPRDRLCRTEEGRPQAVTQKG